MTYGKNRGWVIGVLGAMLGWALQGATTVVAAPVTGWADLHDGGALFNDDGYRCLVAADGHLVVVGESTEAAGGADILVRKLDHQDGSELWSFRFDGYDDKDVAISDITWDSAGQLLVAGYIRGCVG